VWPFARWGIDIVGPLPTAPGNYTHTVVAVEYFSKWVEVKPLLSITSATIQKFIWKNIVCRFGVPHEVTVDNGKQFDSADFKKFCTYLGTKPFVRNGKGVIEANDHAQGSPINSEPFVMKRTHCNEKRTPKATASLSVFGLQSVSLFHFLFC
jgi:hypothetical protein